MNLTIETYSTYMYKTTNSLQVKQVHVNCKLITIFLRLFVEWQLFSKGISFLLLQTVPKHHSAPWILILLMIHGVNHQAEKDNGVINIRQYIIQFKKFVIHIYTKSLLINTINCLKQIRQMYDYMYFSTGCGLNNSTGNIY